LIPFRNPVKVILGSGLPLSPMSNILGNRPLLINPPNQTPPSVVPPSTASYSGTAPALFARNYPVGALLLGVRTPIFPRLGTALPYSRCCLMNSGAFPRRDSFTGGGFVSVRLFLCRCVAFSRSYTFYLGAVAGRIVFATIPVVPPGGVAVFRRQCFFVLSFPFFCRGFGHLGFSGFRGVCPVPELRALPPPRGFCVPFLSFLPW